MIDSDEDLEAASDGESALRDVEAQEAKKGACRGPQNESMAYFHDPTPVVDKKKLRWEFKCRHCSA